MIWSVMNASVKWHTVLISYLPPNIHGPRSSRIYKRHRKRDPHSKSYINTSVYGSRPSAWQATSPKCQILPGRQGLYMQNSLSECAIKQSRRQRHGKAEETSDHLEGLWTRRDFRWILMTLKQKEIDGQARNTKKNQWLTDGDRKKRIIERQQHKK